MEIRRIPDPTNPLTRKPQPPQPQPPQRQEPPLTSDEEEELREIRELRRIRRALEALPPDPEQFIKSVDKYHTGPIQQSPAPAQSQSPMEFMESVDLPDERYIPEERYVQQEVRPNKVVVKSRFTRPPEQIKPEKYDPRYNQQIGSLPATGLPGYQEPRESHIAVPEPEPAGRPYRSILLAVLGIVGGIALLSFGIFNAGGFYETGSRLSGDLARFFYVFQIANIMEVVGILIIWVYAKKVKELLWTKKPIPEET